ncbi:MAG: sulfatase-like hydrolase/transferase, partial [Proteobacteria bacterium]|nr:sulfatase-like hydrolase/transferase [Pseudomonadota bacterium]
MEPKNLIVFVSDEHSRRYSGCYGDPIIKTPNIDRLAETGTRFSKAYAPSPTCVASRASLATGRWAHQTGFCSSFEAYDGSIPSWGHRLIDAGHQVVSFGKIGYRESSPSNGFSREFLPIHNMNGLGWMGGLLRNPVYIREGSLEARAFADHIGCGESDYTKYDRVVCD